MTILNPWALISLISLLVLLLIYILKPNFQQKLVSSTYIWKLSLKYKKKKLPINKFRNILLIICQIIVLSLLTIVLIKPVKITGHAIDNEVILILDSSASMRAESDNTSRYDRAIDLIKAKANEVFDKGGIVSIISAEKNPRYLFERLTNKSRWELESSLDELKNDDNCTYGTVNLDDATDLCQKVLNINPDATIYVYTDNTVGYVTEGLEVINVQRADEYNVAILDAYAEIIDGYYSYVVEIACYGRDMTVDLKIDIYNANETSALKNDGRDIEIIKNNIELSNDNTVKVVFINDNIDLENYPKDENTIFQLITEDDRIFSYESVHLSIEEDDSFYQDNTFEIYGGTKEVINVLYASSLSNSFFYGILKVIKNSYRDRYDVKITEVTSGMAPTSGFDLYIYEHNMMPSTAPVDGVVIYADPQVTVANSGFRCGSNVALNQNGLSLSEIDEHQIIKNVNADNIIVSQVMTINSVSEDYKILMSCGSYPALLVADNEMTKSIIMPFSLHYSNLPLLVDFPIFMLNIFDYFLPSIIDDNSYGVNEDITIRSRSNEIIVEGNENKIVLDSFPSKISFDLPGTYTIRQTTDFDKELKNEIYIKIPKAESNIFGDIDTIINPINGTEEQKFTEDLLFWFAVALCSLVFIEWILKGKDTI